MPKKSAAAKESASAVRSERRARKQADREAQRRKRVKDQIGTSVRYTGVKGTATITLPSSSSYATTAHACRRIDDEAMLYFGMLPPELCDEIIQCARLRTFSLEADAVDARPVYQIDLVRDGSVVDEGLWSRLESHVTQRLVPLLAELSWLVGTHVALDFVFLKRYCLEERTHLGLHVDENFFTFNILLSDPVTDFNGGELYIFDPVSTARDLAESESLSTLEKATWVAAHGDALPIVRDYGRGDVLAFTGSSHFHGILPVLSGERYVLTFFFDTKVAFDRKFKAFSDKAVEMIAQKRLARAETSSGRSG